MKGPPGLDASIVLPLFGILQRVITIIMKFIRRRKLLLLNSLNIRMGSGRLEKRPLLHSVSLLYM
jgi:hypothetical protein